MTRAGPLGGLMAWLGFTTPSAAALILFAYGVATFDIADAGWLHGLKVVAVAVVAYAVWGMARNLCPDRPRATLAILATIAMLAAPNTIAQIAIIVAGGLSGWLLLKNDQTSPVPGHLSSVGRVFAVASLAILAALLVGLPLLNQAVSYEALDVFDSFFRVGSLVFGGGHVVLPLLQAEVVPPGWVTNDAFIAGYGASQAVPGPLFTFSAYLGETMQLWPIPSLGGMFTLTAIFLPSFLLVAGALPFWDRLRAVANFRRALMGINAAVVGLLLAALYDPVWASAIFTASDFALGLAAFGLLAFWKTPPWLVVVLTALGGQLLSLL
jgi:chromate transporter